LSFKIKLNSNKNTSMLNLNLNFGEYSQKNISLLKHKIVLKIIKDFVCFLIKSLFLEILLLFRSVV
jgi:hypothetical protein